MIERNKHHGTDPVDGSTLDHRGDDLHPAELVMRVVAGDASGTVTLAAPLDIGVKATAPRVIGLCGVAGSGKSTAAAALEREGYTRLRFAGPLKAMTRTALAAAGALPAMAERLVEGDLKEAATPYLGGKSPRHFMQGIGEWGRREIHPDYWAGLVMAEAEEILAQGGRVVLEDVRHLNEASATKGSEIDQLMGVRELWHVKGRRAHLLGAAADHVSEQDPARLLPDRVLHNTRSIDDLHRQVLEQILG